MGYVHTWVPVCVAHPVCVLTFKGAVQEHRGNQFLTSPEIYAPPTPVRVGDGQGGWQLPQSFLGPDPVPYPPDESGAGFSSSLLGRDRVEDYGTDYTSLLGSVRSRNRRRTLKRFVRPSGGGRIRRRPSFP